MGETIAVIIMALGWWIPTFVCLSDLEARTGLTRKEVWKWRVVLAVPVAGYLYYRRRGRSELDRSTDAKLRRGR